MNPTRSILKELDQSTKHVLNTCCHEAFEQGFGHIPNIEFWAIFKEKNKKWNEKYRPLPPNYHLLYNRAGQEQLPLWLDFDLILSHNKFDSYQTLFPYAQQLQLPLISVEHTCRMPNWGLEHLKRFNGMRGDANIFITEWSLESWQWERDESTFVIPHTINTELFKPLPQNSEIEAEKKNICLVVANDLIGRGPILGWETYKKIATKYPVKFIGDTPGLSKPAESVEELVKAYQDAKVILNAAPLSPIPTNLLEGMACECVPISLNACAVPDYVNEENGFLCENDEDFMKAIEKVFTDESLAIEKGKLARQTILEKCDINRWVKQWEEVINYVL